MKLPCQQAGLPQSMWLFFGRGRVSSNATSPGKFSNPRYESGFIAVSSAVLTVDDAETNFEWFVCLYLRQRRHVLLPGRKTTSHGFHGPSVTSIPVIIILPKCHVIGTNVFTDANERERGFCRNTLANSWAESFCGARSLRGNATCRWILQPQYTSIAALM